MKTLTFVRQLVVLICIFIGTESSSASNDKALDTTEAPNIVNTSTSQLAPSPLTEREVLLVEAVTDAVSLKLQDLIDRFERRCRLQDARIEELSCYIRLLQGQLATRPKFKYGIDDTSDSESQDSSGIDAEDSSGNRP